MTLVPTSRHALSCGLLLIPAILWNILLADQLPPAFLAEVSWHDIPDGLAFAENASRIVVFALPFLMPLEQSSHASRRGLLIFAAGTVVYFSSWLALIWFPSSSWSTSALGFVAPAYTPAFWLLGIALTGRQLFWGAFYRWWMYLPFALVLILKLMRMSRLPASRFPRSCTAA